MKSKILIILIHITAWIVFFSIPLIFFSPIPLDLEGNIKISQRQFLSFITSNILLIGVFYMNSQILIPRLLFRKKYLLYASTLLLLFLGFMSYGTLLFHPHPRNHFPPPGHFGDPGQLNAIYLFIMVVFISGAIRIVQEWLNIEKKNRQMEAERLQSELSFLHAQINPHFLFNTLNSIYGLSLIRSERAADAVMRLSSLMRYTLQEVGKEKVSLEEEIQSIQNFVEIQKLRLSPNVEVNMIITGDLANKEVPPLILLGFVENAFKYGTSSHEKTTIRIEIETLGNTLEFRTVNNIFPGRSEIESFGIGTKNSERRLQLIYPGRHTFTFKNDNNLYQVHLTIHLK
jgi:two-component system, LytTR family, sensor kinase